MFIFIASSHLLSSQTFIYEGVSETYFDSSETALLNLNEDFMMKFIHLPILSMIVTMAEH